MSPDSSRIRQRLSQEIQDYLDLGKALLAVRGPLILGWLHVRYTSCRKGNCKCTQGKPHGPFLYASLKRRGGAVVQRYVGKSEDDLLVRRIKGYREFRQQIKRLQKLQDQLAGDWKRLEKSLVAKS